MSDDLVKRLREGVWGRARRADAVIHAAMQDGAEHIESQADRIAELEAALLNLIEHTLDCELELDKFHGLGNDAGAGMSSVLCEARAALGEKE